MTGASYKMTRRRERDKELLNEVEWQHFIVRDIDSILIEGKKKRNTNLYAYKRLNSQDKTEKESIGPSTTNLPKTNSKHETKTDGSCEDSTVASNKDIKSPCTPISATGTPDVLSDNEQHLISKQMQPHPLATARDGIVGNSTESSRKYKPPYFEEASNENQNSCGQVFIIYCKDDNPPVEELSYWLRHNCGIDSDIDAYHSIEDIVDWNQWTEKKINDCCDNGYILLLCGKNLYQLLQKSSGNDKINMHHGFIGTLALRNLIQDKSKNFKFLPVFFDHENEAFLPSELKSRSRYIIHTDTIKKDIGCKNPEAILKLKVNQSFSTLIYKIIGQKGNVKPSIITCSASYDTSGKSSLTAHNESEKLVLKKASNDV